MFELKEEESGTEEFFRFLITEKLMHKSGNN